MRRNRLLTVLTLWAILLAPSLAHSQPQPDSPVQDSPAPPQSDVLAEYGLDPTARGAAQSPLEDARTKMNAGDCAAALQPLQAADAVVQAPTIKLALATCYENLNQLLQAERALSDIDAIPVAADEPPS